MLAIASHKLISEILLQHGYTAGRQAHFYHHWKEWIAHGVSNNVKQSSVTTNENTEMNANDNRVVTVIQSSTDNNNESTDYVKFSTVIAFFGKKSRDIQTYYEKFNHLMEQHRISLLDMVVEYASIHGKKLSVSNCRDIAHDIVATFPTELVEKYHSKTNGKLLAKFNYRHRTAKRLAPTDHGTSSHQTPINSNTPSISDDELRDAVSELKNSQLLTAERFQELWEKTASNRYEFISNNYQTPKIVYAQWNQYASPLGHLCVRSVSSHSESVFLFPNILIRSFFLLKL